MQRYASIEKFIRGELKYKDLLYLGIQIAMVTILVMASPSTGNWLSRTFKQKLKLYSLLLGYFVVHVCMFLWNEIDPISQHAASTSMHNNQL